MIQPTLTSDEALRAIEAGELLSGLLIFSAQGELRHSDSWGRTLRARLQGDRELLDEVRRLALWRDDRGEAQLALRQKDGHWLQVNLSRLGRVGADVAVTLTTLPPKAGRLGRSGSARLTPRERQVAALAGQGLANSEIARELATSPNTVKQHLANAYRKTGAAGRDELAAFLE
jgi:DNA-binding CsgD family transcriptional regulator